MMSRIRRFAFSLVSLALLGGLLTISLAASGCKRTTPESPRPAVQTGTSQQVEPPPATPTPEPTATVVATTAPEATAKTTVRVYLIRGEHLGVGTGRTAPAASPARVAMQQLLAGPNTAERRLGLGSEIPDGTKLLGVSISAGTATVNLSKRFESGGGTLSMTLRIAQVVNTLTQFKGVTKVAFKIEGKRVDSIGGEGLIVSPPVDRADYDSALPAIMLESPLPNSAIRSPVRITGNANTFEAQFMVRLTDASGKILAEKPVTATSGTGTRGTFDTLVTFKSPKSGRGTLTVYESSAKDGSEINKVRIPVNL